VEFKHKSVLLNECIKELNIKSDGIYVDGTLGGAGHSKEILRNLSPKGILIGIDKDIEALKAAKDRLQAHNNVKYVHGNHDDIKTILDLGFFIGCFPCKSFKENLTLGIALPHAIHF